MFHPTSNRIAGFLEISALSIALARSGGWQVKAGMLQIVPSGKGSGFGRKGASTVERKKMRWCSIRESYLVAVEDPGEVSVRSMLIDRASHSYAVERLGCIPLGPGLQN